MDRGQRRYHLHFRTAWNKPLKFARTRNALHWIWRQLLTWSLVALLLLACWVGLGRELMPLVANYKGNLEVQLSARVGVPVHIQSLRGEWDGLAPYFVAEGIELRDPKQPQRVLLRLPGLTTRPAIVRSLVHLEPRLISTLSGLSLHLQQQPDGHLEIAELSLLASSDPAAARQTLSLLLRQPYFALEDGHIELDLNGRPPLVMSDLSLSSLNASRQHWLQGSFHVPGAPQRVSVILHFQGDPLDWPQGDLHAYLKTPALTLDGWLQGLALPEVALQSARAGGEYWLDFHEGSLQSVSAQLVLPQARLLVNVGGHSSSYDGKNLQGLLRLQHDPQGWTFSANNLSGEINGQPLPAPRFALRLHDQQIELTTAQLALGPLRQLAQTAALLPPVVQGWLQSLALTGWVPHMRISVTRGANGQLGLPTVEAQFKALALNSHKGLPGINNVAGWLALGPDGGLVYLDSRNARVDLHQFLHEPIVADSVSGGLRLHRSDTAWLIQSGPLLVSNSDASGSAVLSLEVPVKDPGAAQMHLLASLHDAKAASAWRYTPWPVAGEQTLAWMKAAFTDGTVSSGSILFDGPLNTRKDLPDNQIQLRFQLRDGSLAYQPGWPPVTNMQADVFIDNSRLTVTSPGGQVYGTHADKVSAVIPDLNHPVLSVSANLHGPADDITRLFRESPLKDTLGSLGQSMSLDGDVIGQLDLLVPFDSRPLQVRVEADLPGNGLKLVRQQLQIQQLQGHISYSTEQGLSSKRLDGRLFDKDLVARIGSQVHGGELGQVRIDVDGHVSVPALQQWSGSSLLHYMDGDSDYQAEITVPADSHPSQLVLSSSLEGLRINLPAPFGKGLEAMPLRYQTELAEGKTTARLQLGKQHINIGMNLQDGQVQGVLLRVDEGGIGFPDQPGLSVEARVPHVNVADWQRWWSANGIGAKGDSAMLPLNSAVLDSRELVAGGYVLRGAHVEASHDDGVWSITLDSDRLSGTVTLPPAGNPQAGIGVALDQLTWPLPTVGTGEVGQSGLPPELADMPIGLHIAELKLDSWPLLGASSVSAHILASAYAVSVSHLAVSNGSSSASFQGTLDWQWQGGAKTRIDGSLQGGDIGLLLSHLGFSPTINTGKTHTDVRLSWDGGPEDFSLAGLNGHFDSQACKGRLLNVGLVTSASRIFGLFDPDNIKRRLHLDVSDVTRKGVGFDEAVATADVHGGVLTGSHFAFNGPSMSAEGRGQIDLNHKVVDQDISVTLPVAAGALPAAIAFAVNPLAGAVAVGLDYLGSKELGKLSTLHYHVSGNWDDPQVVRGAPALPGDKPHGSAKPAAAKPAEKDKELAPLCSEKT